MGLLSLLTLQLSGFLYLDVGITESVLVTFVVEEVTLASNFYDILYYYCSCPTVQLYDFCDPTEIRNRPTVVRWMTEL